MACEDLAGATQQAAAAAEDDEAEEDKSPRRPMIEVLSSTPASESGNSARGVGDVPPSTTQGTGGDGRIVDDGRPLDPARIPGLRLPGVRGPEDVQRDEEVEGEADGNDDGAEWEVEQTLPTVCRPAPSGAQDGGVGDGTQIGNGGLVVAWSARRGACGAHHPCWVSLEVVSECWGRAWEWRRIPPSACCACVMALICWRILVGTQLTDITAAAKPHYGFNGAYSGCFTAIQEVTKGLPYHRGSLSRRPLCPVFFLPLRSPSGAP